MAAITSTQSGNWSSPSTWTGGAVPIEGDTSTVASGHTVTVDQNIVIGADSGNALTINGIFDVPYNIASDYSLTLKGNIAFGSGGEFKIGDGTNRLSLARIYTIYINYSASLAARKYAFTVPNTGKLSWYGVEKTMNTTLSGNATAGVDPTITVALATGWQVGDIIVMVDETDRTKTEELTIKAGYTPESTTVPLSGTLSNNKTSGWFVANMTSNIIVKNYNDTYISYFALSGTGTSQNVLSNVMFNNLGDATQNGVQCGATTTDNSNSNFNISLYKCYKLTLGNNCNCQTINSYLDDNIAVSFASNSVIDKINTINAVGGSIDFLGSVYNKINAINMHGGSTNGIGFQSVNYIDINTLYATSVASGVVNRYAINSSSGVFGENICINTATIKNSVYGIAAHGKMKIKNLACSGNTSGDIRLLSPSGDIIIENWTDQSTTPIVGITGSGTASVTNYANTVGDNKIFYGTEMKIESETTVYRTTSPSLKININNTFQSFIQLWGNDRAAYVTSGKTITLNLYSRKDATSTGAVAKLRIAKGTDGHGLSETAEYDILPASTDTWTSQSINLGTTTSAGFINIELVVSKGASTWNLYIDDLTFTES